MRDKRIWSLKYTISKKIQSNAHKAQALNMRYNIAWGEHVDNLKLILQINYQII